MRNNLKRQIWILECKQNQLGYKQLELSEKLSKEDDVDRREQISREIDEIISEILALRKTLNCMSNEYNRLVG